MVVMGIFDDADTLENGLSLLSRAGFGAEVQRLEGAPGAGTPGGAGASEGGAEPLDLSHSPGVTAPWPTHLAASETPLIAGDSLDEEERGYYRRLLEEGGRLIAVAVDADRADEAARLLDEAGATRVARHAH